METNPFSVAMKYGYHGMGTTSEGSSRYMRHGHVLDIGRDGSWTHSPVQGAADNTKVGTTHGTNGSDLEPVLKQFHSAHADPVYEPPKGNWGGFSRDLTTGQVVPVKYELHG